jgi:protocatechuate 3,4-dioxygenase beta subunit
MPRIASTKPGRPLVVVALVVLLGVVGWRRTGDSSAARADHDVAGRSAAQHAKPVAGEAPVLGVTADDDPAAAAPDGALRLEGQVLDLDEKPVGGAKVTLGGNRSVVSEADGSFAFESLPEGTYDLVAAHDDAFAEAQGFDLDAHSDPVMLTLVRGPTLIVHVVDDHGWPIAGARVEVGRRSFVTEAAGSVRFRGVETDSVYVQVAAEGHAHVQQRQNTSEDPGATVECTIALPAGSLVSGRVLDENGLPVAEAWVQLASAGGHRNVVFSEADGTWEIANVASGDYVLHSTSRLHISAGELAFAHDASHATTDLIVRVKRGAEISGVVVDRAGHPLAGADVFTGGHSEVTDERGEFLFRGLDEDIYSVSATTKTQGAASQRVELAHGQHVRVTFVLETSSLAGRVVDGRGEPVDDAMVYARSDDLGTVTVEHSDPYGHFDLGGLAPGRYGITAQRPNSRLESVALEVDTTNRRLELRVPDRASVTGRVVLQGVPVPHFRFSLSADPDRDRSLQVYNPTGQFTERDAAPGTYFLVISGGGLARQVVPNVTLVAGQVLDLGDIAVVSQTRPIEDDP